MASIWLSEAVAASCLAIIMGSPWLLCAFIEDASLLAWSAAAASDETAAFCCSISQPTRKKLQQLNKAISSLLDIPGPAQPAAQRATLLLPCRRCQRAA